MAPPLPSPIRSAHTFFPLVGYPNIRFTLHQPAPRLSANSPDRLLRHDFGREFTGDSESAIRFKPAAGLCVEKDEFSASGPGFTLVQFKQRRGTDRSAKPQSVLDLGLESHSGDGTPSPSPCSHRRLGVPVPSSPGLRPGLPAPVPAYGRDSQSQSRPVPGRNRDLHVQSRPVSHHLSAITH